MGQPNIKSTEHVVPMCYAYTTPGVTYNEGFTKIGYTERDVDVRIKEQTQTAHIKYKKEWEGEARFDNSGKSFKDTQFHAYLTKQGIVRMPPEPEDEFYPEWFQISGPDAEKLFYQFRADEGILKSLADAMPYRLRKEQSEAVQVTKDYFTSHEYLDENQFLWNAKPRFGKTLTAYDLCKALNAEKVLVVTNRPAIATSWYNDYEAFLGTKSGYYFVSNVDALKGRTYVVSREKYLDLLLTEKDCRIIEFVSLQDMKGSKYFNPHSTIDKLGEVVNLEWDVLIIDEAHEGVDTFKTDVAFNQIKRKYTLYLSGTPFKALANDKFHSDAIYNWTYADEQRAKEEWDVHSEYENPYETLPRLNLFTYRLSDIIRDKLAQGADFRDNGDKDLYAFDLNEFFKTNNNGVFEHDADVDKLLTALCEQEKFPFSTPELRNELKHSLWVLNRIASAKALYRKLREHPVFKDYYLILAAGDGKVEDDSEDLVALDKAIKSSYDKVVNAIKTHDKTITLSVGQLTTGITIPQWTAVLMLSNMKSHALYMQTAFRAQNPCMFEINGQTYRKENAYVFDFDPARTLDIFEKVANDLSEDTAGNKGDTFTRKKHVRELLNFFSVYGEDEDGRMEELDPERVLSIPRIIHAKEVVRRGFMCNFLLQNIPALFRAPAIANDIVGKKMGTASNEPLVNRNTGEELHLDENGDVSLSDEDIEVSASELFGDKIYGDEITEEMVNEAEAEGRLSMTNAEDDARWWKDTASKKVQDIVAKGLEQNFDSKDVSKAKQKNILKEVGNKVANKIDTLFTQYQLEQRQVRDHFNGPIEEAKRNGDFKQALRLQRDRRVAVEANTNKFRQSLRNELDYVSKEALRGAAASASKAKYEAEKAKKEEEIRDHLRGFMRSIPAFLMAYGKVNDEPITLATLDKVVPADVFEETTGITLADFILLRDGGLYKDENGEEKMFDGHVFDEVVFDDSVKEFMCLRAKLANYFEVDAKEDIFDYIPPQQTNQIYTPRKVVKQMVDYLEQENPGCFDNPDATFADLYMKSGLYITEIVKRLYRSKEMQSIFPDREERLQWIFQNQVYGCAPTEIIYRIATNYIFGFTENGTIASQHHFKQFDTLVSAQRGTLSEDLDKVFADDKAKKEQ